MSLRQWLRVGVYGLMAGWCALVAWLLLALAAAMGAMR